jgi:hypothetical protein
VNRLGCAASRNSVAGGMNFNHTFVLDVSGSVFDVSTGAMALNGTLNSKSASCCINFHVLLDQHHGLRGCDVLSLVDVHMSASRSIGAADRLIIWHPIKLIVNTTDDVQRYSFACGNLSLLAPYFGLFQ